MIKYPSTSTTPRKVNSTLTAINANTDPPAKEIFVPLSLLDLNTSTHKQDDDDGDDEDIADVDDIHPTHYHDKQH